MLCLWRAYQIRNPHHLHSTKNWLQHSANTRKPQHAVDNSLGRSAGFARQVVVCILHTLESLCRALHFFWSCCSPLRAVWVPLHRRFFIRRPQILFIEAWRKAEKFDSRARFFGLNWSTPSTSG